jgi:hypothetical protein
MAYHPAEFARKGYKLLNEILKTLKKNKNDSTKIRELINQYDSEVRDLLNSRLDWTERDYLIKNIESFIVGSIGSMVLILMTVVILEQTQLINLPSLTVTIQIYLGITILGGVFWTFMKGPKNFTAEEKENEILIELSESPYILKQKYNSIKKLYKKILKPPSNEEKPEETKNDLPPLVLPEDKKDNKKNKKKDGKKGKPRQFGLSEAELEERKTMHSLRFLMKVAKLKEGREEEPEDQTSVVFIIEPDENSLESMVDI